PFVELYVIIQVGHIVGVVPTIALLVVISLLGASLCKREGLAVIRRIQEQLAERRLPGVALLDGALVLLAGALLLTPGFVTDGVGLLLLLPPVRAGARRILKRALLRRVVVTTTLYES
ncbi:MAG: FxsA family protein, partial [Actinobacteria bacterium]